MQTSDSETADDGDSASGKQIAVSISERHFKSADRYSRYIGQALAELRSNKYDKEDLTQFFAFAAPLANRSRGQLFQDLWALWESGTRRGGYFVEFGAANGVRLSNSYLLETDFGWSGVVAEPNPRFVPMVRRSRKCKVFDKCVYSVSGEKVAFLPAPSGELSRMKDIVPDDQHERAGRRSGGALEEVVVETISLNDLLLEAKAPKCIDYMSVDTEGSEYKILSAFDFSRWDIRCISVEHNGTQMREQLLDLLVGNGYRRKWTSLSRFDDWYVRL